MTGELSTKMKQFRLDVKAALPTFGLPTERQQERMSSVMMVAVEKNPDLLFADRQSLISAARQCANHGLMPDGNEATLQVYNSKVKRGGKEEWIHKVQYQPMVRGIVNRIQRSGKVDTVWAEVVYKGEVFRIDISKGDRRPIHDPDFFNREEGEIVGVYAVAKMANGTIDCEPVSMRDLEKIKGVAKTKNVWDSWFEEKAKVAALRRLSKRLPLASDDLDMIINADEHDFSNQTRDVTPTSGMAALAKEARDAAAEPEPEEAIPEDPEPKKAKKKTADIPDAEVVDDTITPNPKSDAFKAGKFAAEGKLGRGTCPKDKDAQYVADWFAGYDSVDAKAEG